MGRYTIEDQKGYKAAVVQGEAAVPLTEVEKELYACIEKLEGVVERLEERISISESDRKSQN